jgi:hypothetical protein
MTRMIEGKEASGLVQGDVIITRNGEHRTIDVTMHATDGFHVTYSGGGNDTFDSSDLIDFAYPQEARY